MRFKDKVVVVTGGNAGIGRATADRFAREAAIVAINGSRADRVEAAVTEVIGSGGHAVGIVGDVTDREAVRRNVTDIMERHGKIDVLINNAGIVASNPAERYDQFERIMAVNVAGMFNWAQLVATHSMIPQKKGCIVNVSSLAGLQAIKLDVGYVTSKAAVVGLTRALALDWAQFNIRVNCVAPGLTESAMMAGFASEQPEQHAKFCANIPLQRLARATEQAESRIPSSCSTKKLLMRRRISKLFIARRMNRASAATCSWLAGITIAFRADPANGVYRDARLISIGFAISATPAIGRPGHTASAMTPRTSVRRMKRDGPSSERCSSRAARLFD